MDIWSAKDNFPKNQRAHMFFYFFVCMFWNDREIVFNNYVFKMEKHSYKMMLMKNVFNISCANLKIKAVILFLKNMRKQFWNK